jgi:uncharacterized membrane protein YqjE
MGEGNLSGGYRVVVGDIGRRIPATVLQFDVEAHQELFNVELAFAPVDTDRLSDAPGVV